MQIRSFLHSAETADHAVALLKAELREETPDFLVLNFNADLGGPALHGALTSTFGTRAIHGCSSAKGVMSERGLALGGGAVASLAFFDPKGAFGTASRAVGQDARTAAAAATEAALIKAGRPGEAPDMVWVTAAPGHENAVLAGIKDVVGAATPIVGGSSGDNDMSGQWVQLCGENFHNEGVAVSVLFPSAPVASSRHSGYSPSAHSAMVTRIEGRRLIALDDRPARDVYAEWTGLDLSGAERAQLDIAGRSILTPLGQINGNVGGVEFHRLAHPVFANPDGSVDLLADLRVGERCWMMESTPEALVDRSVQVARQARDLLGGPVGGAMLVCCAGYLEAMQEQVTVMRQGIADALGSVPFIGLFANGEQGSAIGHEADHGNLLVYCILFGERSD